MLPKTVWTWISFSFLVGLIAGGVLADIEIKGEYKGRIIVKTEELDIEYRSSGVYICTGFKLQLGQCIVDVHAFGRWYHLSESGKIDDTINLRGAVSIKATQSGLIMSAGNISTPVHCEKKKIFEHRSGDTYRISMQLNKTKLLAHSIFCQDTTADLPFPPGMKIVVKGQEWIPPTTTTITAMPTTIEETTEEPETTEEVKTGLSVVAIILISSFSGLAALILSSVLILVLVCCKMKKNKTQRSKAPSIHSEASQTTSGYNQPLAMPTDEAQEMAKYGLAVKEIKGSDPAPASA